ncbi:lamin tail domain-containing protein [Streptomyces sp. NPDC020490]|uniref:lamin tail domain-containing protein n=1 Tax=Streptomyces sp. NPDC020490 TaxID=3365078 RepID=UPI0037B085F8
MSVSSSVRRLAAACGVAAAVLGAVTLPAAAADHGHGRSYRERVVISGVQYDSPGWEDRSNRSLNREWVDITNDSRRAVDLDGWTLSDEDGYTYTFRRVWLEGGSTVRVHTGFGRDTSEDLYQDRRDYVWDNDYDTATLRNDRGRFIDEFSWGGDRRDRRDGDDRYRHHRDGGHRWDGDRRRDVGDRRTDRRY